MSDTEFQGQEKARFPLLLVLGVLMGVAVVIVAFAAEGAEVGIPVLLLLAICVAAAIGFRLISGRNRDESDATDNVMRVQPDTERPLGDTPDAHDELNPHDLPLSNPGRHEAERMAQGAGGTTTGHDQGGGSTDGERVSTAESQRGADAS